MLYDVIEAKYKDNYRLTVKFENGNQGIVDFSEYPSRGGVFSQFKDIEFFKSFVVSKDLGTIVWGDEIDIAPETLYQKCQPEH